jgi:hypothetical protein
LWLISYAVSDGTSNSIPSFANTEHR